MSEQPLIEVEGSSAVVEIAGGPAAVVDATVVVAPVAIETELLPPPPVEAPAGESLTVEAPELPPPPAVEIVTEGPQGPRGERGEQGIPGPEGPGGPYTHLAQMLDVDPAVATAPPGEVLAKGASTWGHGRVRDLLDVLDGGNF